MKITAYRSIAKPRIPIPIMHSQAEVSYILDTIMKHQPGLIIELGTCWGGLTLAMNQAVPKAMILSFDREYRLDQVTRDSFTKKVHIVIVKDLITEVPALISETSWAVKQFVYCDNGDKIREFKYMKQLLKPGDLIGVHDYLGAVESEVKKEAIDMELLTPPSSDITARIWRR